MLFLCAVVPSRWRDCVRHDAEAKRRAQSSKRYASNEAFNTRSTHLCQHRPHDSKNVKDVTPSIHVSDYLPVCLAICLSFCPSARPSIYLSIHLSTYLSIHFLIHPSVHPSIYIYPLIRPFVCLTILCLSICPSLCLSLYSRSCNR